MSATDEGFTNQAKPEQIPPTPSHDVPDTTGDRAERPAPEAGTASTPGARVSNDGPGPVEGGQPTGSTTAPSPPGGLPGDRETGPDLGAGITQGPHDSGRPAPEGVGRAFRVPGHMGDTPEPVDTDVDEGARRVQQGITSSGVASPGDTATAPRATHYPAAGTSETSDAVNGVRIPAIVQPGKPDGEYDTRVT